MLPSTDCVNLPHRKTKGYGCEVFLNGHIRGMLIVFVPYTMAAVNIESSDSNIQTLFKIGSVFKVPVSRSHSQKFKFRRLGRDPGTCIFNKKLGCV